MTERERESAPQPETDATTTGSVTGTGTGGMGSVAGTDAVAGTGYRTRSEEGDETLGASGSTHSEIGARGGGAPGAQAAAEKRAETGEDRDLLADARGSGTAGFAGPGGPPTEAGVTEDGGGREEGGR